MFLRKRGLLVSGMVLFGLLLAACGAPTAIPATSQAAPTQPPRATEPPTAEPTVAALEPTTAAAAAPAGDAEAGKKIWAAKSCRYCHGDTAQGIGAPKLAGTALTWDEILGAVRNGRPGTQMQAFKPSVITEKELADMYAWWMTQ